MSSSLSLDPMSALRTAIAEIEQEPGPLTPELVLLRELLDDRLRRLEGESQLINGNTETIRHRSGVSND